MRRAMRPVTLAMLTLSVLALGSPVDAVAQRKFTLRTTSRRRRPTASPPTSSTRS